MLTIIFPIKIFQIKLIGRFHTRDGLSVSNGLSARWIIRVTRIMRLLKFESGEVLSLDE